MDGGSHTELARHQEAAQAIYDALTFGISEQLVSVLNEKLTLEERCHLLFAFVAGLDNYQAYECFRQFKICAGIPDAVPFETTIKDAAAWAMLANRNELKCYSVQAFKQMSGQDQRAFLKHVRSIYEPS